MKINIHFGNSLTAMESMPDKKYGFMILCNKVLYLHKPFRYDKTSI